MKDMKVKDNDFSLEDADAALILAIQELTQTLNRLNQNR